MNFYKKDNVLEFIPALFQKLGIEKVLGKLKSIHPRIRNKAMNVFYTIVVSLAFILSLINNNDVSASVSPKEKLDYLLLENSIFSPQELEAQNDLPEEFVDEPNTASIYPQKSVDSIRELLGMVQSEDVIQTVEKDITLSQGDTFIKLLTDQGLSYNDAHDIYLAVKPLYKPESLRAGQVLHISSTIDTQKNALISLDSISLEPKIGQKVIIRKNDDGKYSAQLIKDDLIEEVKSAVGVVDGSLSSAMRNAGVPSRVSANFINIFSYSVDFRCDIKKGDKFEIIYEQYLTPEGKLVKSGNILYAALVLRNDRIALFRYKDKSGNVDYYDEKGFAMKKTLYRKPLAFQAARISSPFGKRKHPIKKRWIIHWGVDYAAPRGTKIYAAGDGVIQTAKYNGGYGNYVKIRHNSEYSTAYGHMNKIAKGIRPGVRVKQGQVIGYVGSTGLSTGPHLHYEIVRNGKRVNPLKIKAAAGENLSGQNLKRFKQEVAEVKSQFRSMFAQASSKKVAKR